MGRSTAALSVWEWNGSQPGQGATYLLLPQPAPGRCKVRRWADRGPVRRWRRSVAGGPWWSPPAHPDRSAHMVHFISAVYTTQVDDYLGVVPILEGPSPNRLAEVYSLSTPCDQRPFIVVVQLNVSATRLFLALRLSIGKDLFQDDTVEVGEVRRKCFANQIAD